MPVCSKCGGDLQGATGDVCAPCLMKLTTAAFSNPATGEVETPFEPGTVFHGLEIVQILGRGGMGVVYKARQPQLDRFVAVKVLPKSLAADPEFTKRFLQEAKALASLAHPNIVAVHDFGREGERSFIVMEYVDGTNLRSIMKSHRLTPEEALKIVPLLCDALEFAHAEGIVHRDIKPENIMVDKRGRVKVADFGLAKIVRGDAQTVLAGLTQTGVAMGTPHYMAPEQFENTRGVDHRADIYSMGVIFYEMLTGELPIGRFELPSVKSGSDVRLDEIVMRTLEKSPDKRYQSMSDIRRDVANVTTHATAPTLPLHPKSRPPWIWIGVASVLALMVVALATRKPPPSPSPRPSSPSPSPSVAPTPVVADLWTAATIAPAERPKGWTSAQDDWNGESRAEVAEAAGWFGMGDQADGIRRARRVVLKGPNDWKIFLFAWQFKDPKALNASVKIFQDKWLPQLNHALLDKDDVLVFISGQREGRVSPAAEEIEDLLRRKLGLTRARRVDPSLLRPDDLPPGWQETGSRRTDLGDVLAKLKPMAQPPAGEVRDGWLASFADPSASGRTAEVVSIRFYEGDTARSFRNVLRTANPPADAEVRVLQDHTRVVAVFAPAKGDPAPFEKISSEIAKRLGSGSDDVDVKTTLMEVAFTDQWFIVPFLVEGVNGRELARSGSWKIEIWSGSRKGLEIASTCPDDVLVKDGKQEVHLRFGVDGDLRRFLETRPLWLQFRITWTDAKDARPIEFQVGLEGRYPKGFATVFGTRFPTGDDLPLGWRFIYRLDHETYPIIGLDGEGCAEALEVLGEAGRKMIASVDMAFLGRVEPEAKIEGFKALAVLVLKFSEPEAKAAALRALALAPATAKWDRHQVAEKGEIVAVTLFAGTGTEAAAAFDKIAAAMKRRIE